jgi:glycosyltransferase involved in cell wall biosynthesis
MKSIPVRVFQKVREPMTGFVSAIPDRIVSRTWEPYSRIAIKGDGVSWVLTEIANELTKICKALGISVVSPRFSNHMAGQCVFHTSKYFIAPWKNQKNRIAFPYFHGDPSLDPSCLPLIRSIEENHSRIARVWVSNYRMRKLILSTGIQEDKIFRIPISIDMSKFSRVTRESQNASRKNLGIPINSAVIGSFQKDGIGMGEGLRPKLIKGPDIFLQVVQRLKKDIPNLFILLTGPARGYVKNGLKSLAIPYRHIEVTQYNQIAPHFHALDMYMITSREEGGPRAILETMASGIPLVTTRVGQAEDLVLHGENGWIVNVDDVKMLVYWSNHVINQKTSLNRIADAGYQTAKDNSYDAQVDLWRGFFSGFVDF